MKSFASVPPFESKDADLTVIIETPKGSRNKYAYDPGERIFGLRKVLPAGMTSLVEAVKAWFKGQRMATGQCNVKAYNLRLMDLIHHGKATPSMIISHEIPLRKRPTPTNISTTATRAGPKSSCIRKPPECGHGASGYRRLER